MAGISQVNLYCQTDQWFSIAETVSSDIEKRIDVDKPL